MKYNKNSNSVWWKICCGVTIPVTCLPLAAQVIKTIVNYTVFV